MKKFWKVWKPLISDNYRTQNTITLVKGNDIISEDKEVAKEFKQQFSNAVKELNIDYDWQPTSEITGISDPIDKLIETYKDHPSIRKINEHIQTPNPIEFTEVSEESVLEFISKFDTRKATTFKNIPGKLLKAPGGGGGAPFF